MMTNETFFKLRNIYLRSVFRRRYFINELTDQKDPFKVIVFTNYKINIYNLPQSQQYYVSTAGSA